ncbi:MAG: hypothetical protein MUD12_03135 [Spirochaetes bacterium]|jgi:hypothetical protein|nr:hypothetical protein [Spirochaetota bacterium]
MKIYAHRALIILVFILSASSQSCLTLTGWQKEAWSRLDNKKFVLCSVCYTPNDVLMGRLKDQELARLSLTQVNYERICELLSREHDVDISHEEISSAAKIGSLEIKEKKRMLGRDSFCWRSKSIEPKNPSSNTVSIEFNVIKEQSDGYCISADIRLNIRDREAATYEVSYPQYSDVLFRDGPDRESLAGSLKTRFSEIHREIEYSVCYDSDRLYGFNRKGLKGLNLSGMGPVDAANKFDSSSFMGLYPLQKSFGETFFRGSLVSKVFTSEETPVMVVDIDGNPVPPYRIYILTPGQHRIRARVQRGKGIDNYYLNVPIIGSSTITAEPERIVEEAKEFTGGKNYIMYAVKSKDDKYSLVIKEEQFSRESIEVH